MTESRNRVHRFSSTCSIRSTTNRFCLAKSDRLTDKNIAKVTESQNTVSILSTACMNASRIELLEVCLECGIAEELGGGGRFCSAFIHHIFCSYYLVIATLLLLANSFLRYLSFCNKSRVIIECAVKFWAISYF